jgi:hypothetical protein
MASSKAPAWENQLPSTPAYFPVYIARFTVGLKDPDIPGPRFHHTIWVETDPKDKNGVKFHVIGDITSKGGMTYKSEECHDPMAESECHSKEFLGYTAAKDFRESWDRLLRGLPTPPKQKEFNVKTLKTELVKSWEPLTFYTPGEERHVPWKCTEWTNNYALPALHEARLIVPFEDDNCDDVEQPGHGHQSSSV